MQASHGARGEHEADLLVEARRVARRDVQVLQLLLRNEREEVPVDDVDVLHHETCERAGIGGDRGTDVEIKAREPELAQSRERKRERVVPLQRRPRRQSSIE